MAMSPLDAPKDRVVRALGVLGFAVVREGNHIAMARENADGTRTPLTMPNRRRIKASTLRTMLRQSKIPRAEFLREYERADRFLGTPESDETLVLRCTRRLRRTNRRRGECTGRFRRTPRGAGAGFLATSP